MATTCKRCGTLLTGSGSHNGKLCIDCWAHLIVRVQRGEQQKALAVEYGVSEGALSKKVSTYGSED